MAKFVMGKDIASLSQDEKNDLMAKMRSFRKNGNGRLGYKDPSGLIIKTNNFEPLTPIKVPPGQFAKKYNEHVKCVFVCQREIYSEKTAYKQSKIYYLGFLSDSNRFSFEEFRESPPKSVKNEFGGIEYRLKKYCQLFEKKNIDADTTFVLCSDGMKSTDFMAAMLKFMRSFSGCEYSQVSKAKIIKKYIAEYGIISKKATPKIFPKRSVVYKNCENYKPKMLNTLLYEIYLYMTKEMMCPWLTPETREAVLSLPKQKKHSHILVSLGLFYSVILKFKRMESKKLKST